MRLAGQCSLGSSFLYPATAGIAVECPGSDFYVGVGDLNSRSHDIPQTPDLLSHYPSLNIEFLFVIYLLFFLLKMDFFHTKFSDYRFPSPYF